MLSSKKSKIPHSLEHFRLVEGEYLDEICSSKHSKILGCVSKASSDVSKLMTRQPTMVDTLLLRKPKPMQRVSSASCGEALCIACIYSFYCSQRIRQANYQHNRDAMFTLWYPFSFSFIRSSGAWKYPGDSKGDLCTAAKARNTGGLEAF